MVARIELDDERVEVTCVAKLVKLSVQSSEELEMVT